MLFDDEDLAGRRFRNRKAGKKRRKQVLNVKARKSGKNKDGVPKTAVFVLVPVAAIAAGVMIWFLFTVASEQLFSTNDRYTIQTLNIHMSSDSTISKEKISEWAHIQEGMNLFAFDIREVRAGILKHAWNIETLEIRRILPDAVEITVKEREPLARLGRNGVYGIDRNGFVFVLRSRKVLPVLDGYRQAGQRVKPGDQLAGMVQAGLEVLDICDNPAYGMSVQAIDVSGPSHIELHLTGNRSVPLSWAGMGERSAESRKELEKKIRHVVLATKSEQGSRLSRLKAHYGDWIYGEN